MSTCFILNLTSSGHAASPSVSTGYDNFIAWWAPMYVWEHLFLSLFLPFYFLLRLKNNFSFIFMTIQRGRAQTFLMNIICSRIFRPVCIVPYDYCRQQHRNTSCLKKIVIVKNKFRFSVLYYYYSTFTYTGLLWLIWPKRQGRQLFVNKHNFYWRPCTSFFVFVFFFGCKIIPRTSVARVLAHAR